MATIAEQLTELQAVKSGLKTALTADGADMSEVPFTDYPEKVQAMSERWKDFLEKNCTEIDLSGLSTVRSFLCYEYSKLQSINNMDKLIANTIGLSSFEGCTSLKSVTITENIAMLRSAAFRRCTSLQKMVIGSNVFNLGSSNSLDIGSADAPATIILKRTTPPTISTNTFGNYVMRIVVPYASITDYTTDTNWAALSGKFEARLALRWEDGTLVIDQDILDGDVSAYLYRAEMSGVSTDAGYKVYYYANDVTPGQEYVDPDGGYIVFESNPDAEGVSA